MFNKCSSVDDRCDAIRIGIWAKDREIQPYGCA